MKRLWVNVVPYKKEIAIAALESGAEALVLPEGQSGTVRQFGKIKTVEPGGDLKPGVDVEFIDVASKADEDRAASVPANKLVVLKMLDWTIIPIENLLARRGGNLLVQVANSEQAKLMVEILEKGVDGVVLLAPGLLSVRPREIPVPVVSLAHPIEHQRVLNIDVDNVDGGYLAVSHLVGLGHRRIGIVAGVAARKAGNERNEGARRALSEAGLELADSSETSHQWSIDAGYRATHALLERRPDLTALFCHSDTLALGAYRAL
ncbi:MAG TPA: 3-dehydroquinate synthase II, partial [Sedimentisphaerales bacterium]|nr:3-dehydroquinate synthase II [Sedimentisphaerales bacterium]